MARTPWYDSDNPSTVARGATWRGMVWILAITAFVAIISIGGWLFNVTTSDVKGSGDATRTVNSGDNRLAQQAYFEQTYADIQAAGQNLTLPGNETEQAGRLTYCRRLVADYNAAARKQVAAKFRAADLPAQIDAATACPESSK